jgi:hypothetical protein
MRALAFATWLALLQTITPLPAIEAKAPKDIATVEAVNDAMEAFSRKVSACVTAGGPAGKCRCSYPQDLASLRTRYDGLITQHPGWKDQLVSYQYINKDGKNISGTLVLQNLRRQLEALTCN